MPKLKPLSALDPKDQCPCGSGLFKEKQYDGYGIFLCYTCPQCHEEKMGGYRSDIYERYECDEPIDED